MANRGAKHSTGRPPVFGGFNIFMRKVDRRLARIADPVGNFLVDIFHYGALFAIGAATVWAALQEFLLIFEKSHATVEDLLLLFIYLEIGAMVGIYFRTNRMPVRFLVYVAITALTRLLIGEAGKHGVDHMDMIWISGAVFILAVALLLLRFGSARYPSPPSDHESKLK